MSIKIEIIAETVTEMHRELAALLAGSGATTTQAPPTAVESPEPAEQPTKTRTTRKTKAATKEEPKAEAAKEPKAEAAEEPKAEAAEEPKAEAAEEPKAEAKEETKPEAAEPKTIHEVRQLIVKLRGRNDDIAKLLQTKYGVKLIPHIPEERLGELYADLEKL